MMGATTWNYVVVAAGSAVMVALGRYGQRYQWLGLRITWVAAEAGGLGLWVLLSLALTLRVVFQ